MNIELDLALGPIAIGRRSIDIGPERYEAILRVLEAGWKLALGRSDVGPDVYEVPLTERLRDEMRVALDRSTADWCSKMTILPGTESRSSRDVSVPDGLTDIPVYFNELRTQLHEHDPHAIIECKRVSSDDPNLCRLYVVKGINDRFRSGKYSARHAVGFMVGYLLTGTVEDAVGKINSHLSESQKLRPCTVIDEPWARSSEHPRPTSLGPIRLHHAMLDFS